MIRTLVVTAALFVTASAEAALSEYLYVVRPTRPEMVTQGPTEKELAVLKDHGAYLKRLTDDGTVVIAGRTQEAETFGIVVYRAASEEAARAIMNADPAVAAGVMKATFHPYKIAFQRTCPPAQQ